MTVGTQDERAAGASEAAKAFARQPQVVGMHWFQYWDHPKEADWTERITTSAWWMWMTGLTRNWWRSSGR